jgi:hypothetical protein
VTSRPGGGAKGVGHGRLVFLGAVLLSAGNAWGWTLLPAAAAVAALSVWVFTTAAKGWPVVEA